MSSFPEKLRRFRTDASSMETIVILVNPIGLSRCTNQATRCNACRADNLKYRLTWTNLVQTNRKFIVHRPTSTTPPLCV